MIRYSLDKKTCGGFFSLFILWGENPAGENPAGVFFYLKAQYNAKRF